MAQPPTRGAQDQDAVAAIRAARQLRSMITEALLAGGSRLPAERELAALLTCSRATVRRALLALEAEGLVIQTSARVRQVVGRPVSGIAAAGRAQRVAILGGRRALGSLGGSSPSFISVAARHCIEQLGAAGYTALPIVAGSRAWPELLAAQQPIDAVVALSGIATHNSLSAWISHGITIPLIVWAESLPMEWSKNASLDWVRHDHHAGASALVRSMAARGAQRLVVVWWEELDGRKPHWWETERLSGYAAGAQSVDLPRPIVVRLPRPHANPDPQAASLTMQRLAFGFLHDLLTGNSSCTAILASDDQLVPAIAEAVQRIRPTGAVLIAGYDHHAAYAALPGPLPDLTIDQDPQALGTALATCVHTRLTKPATSPMHVLVGPRLVSADPRV